MTPKRFVAFALVALLAAAVPAAAQTTFRDTAQVVVVEVPVHVVADGKPVRGLTADDFELLDGRKRQKLVGFEVIDLTATAGPAAAPPPPAARRHFLLLFDLAFSDLQAVVRARQAAVDILRGTLHPTDVVAVATYTQTRGPQMLLGFTSDRRQAEAAISTLGAPELFDRSADPLNLMLADIDSLEQQVGGDEAAGEGAGGNEGMVLAHLRDMAGRIEQMDRRFELAKVTQLTQSFGALARMLDAVDGRKHVVLLSEGFDSSLLFGAAERSANTSMAIERGESHLVDSQEMFGNTEGQNDLEAMMEEFRRADATVHSVDISGLKAGADVRPKASGKDGLVAIAKGTGGGFYQNHNNLANSMGQLLETTGVTYVLAFQPEKLELDGEYHRIKVKLKNGPRGARLEHRPGYYAPRPLSEQAPLEQQLSIAELILSGEEGGRLDASVLAPPFLVPGESAYVPVLIEVGGPSLLADAGDQEVIATEVFAYAVDAAGGFHDFFNQTVGLEVAKVRPALEQSGIKFYGHLDLAPGSYEVRVLVRNRETGSYGLRKAAVEVPAASSALALLPPLFEEPLGKWLLIREGEAQQQERTVPFPFMTGDQPFLPAARPQLAAGDSARICLVGYNLGSAKVAAKVLDGAGGEVDGGRFEVQGKSAPATGQGDQLTAEFRPAGLAAGEYRLRVTVTDETGASESSSIPFVVTGGKGRGRGR